MLSHARPRFRKVLETKAHNPNILLKKISRQNNNFQNIQKWFSSATQFRKSRKKSEKDMKNHTTNLKIFENLKISETKFQKSSQNDVLTFPDLFWDLETSETLQNIIWLILLWFFEILRFFRYFCRNFENHCSFHLKISFDSVDRWCSDFFWWEVCPVRSISGVFGVLRMALVGRVRRV